MSQPLRCPFPYFGGKRRAAGVVWPRIDYRINNYVEPFCGSLAMLLGRPGGPGKIETVNDVDRMIANFWRAIVADPYAVAAWCDGPVNEADLHARHKWLVQHLVEGCEFRRLMHEDPHFFDAKIAGWWVWGICQWIGGGWCVEPQNHKHPKLDGIGKGVHALAGREPKRQLPDLAVTVDGAATGRGVHSAAGRSPKLDRLQQSNRPDLAGAGRGIHADVAAYSPGRRPALSSAGSGVHLPGLGNDRGIHGVSIKGTFLGALRDLTVPDAPPAFEWFARLMTRLRYVRVACGQWDRVLGESVLGKGENVGGRRPCAVFLDPPYDQDERCSYLYAEDTKGLSAQVRIWALDHGDDPDLRIVLCGYDGEHDMPATWECVEWKGARGYAGEDNANRNRERLWFSPHCVKEAKQGELFG